MRVRAARQVLHVRLGRESFNYKWSVKLPPPPPDSYRSAFLDPSPFGPEEFYRHREKFLTVGSQNSHVATAKTVLTVGDSLSDGGECFLGPSADGYENKERFHEQGRLASCGPACARHFNTALSFLFTKGFKK